MRPHYTAFHEPRRLDVRYLRLDAAAAGLVCGNRPELSCLVPLIKIGSVALMESKGCPFRRELRPLERLELERKAHDIPLEGNRTVHIAYKHDRVVDSHRFSSPSFRRGLLIPL